MGKKRSYRSNSDTSDGDGDQVMNGNKDEVGSPDMLSPSPNTKRKDMHLRSGKRKRRRSKETTGLTPPATSKRAKKKLKIHGDDDNDENGDNKKPSAVTFEESKIAIEDDSSPLAAGPRRISYSGTYAANNPSDEQSGDSEDEEDEESDEIDVVPPKQMPVAATPKQTDAEEVIVQKPPPETDGETKDEIVNEIADGVEPKSTAIPTWQRLVIHAVLGFLGLLLSMPQVVKLTQTVVPLDDSILPPNRRLSSPEEFSKKLETLQEATSEYSSSKTSFEGYFDELLGQIGSVAAQLEPKQKEMEERLENLKQLEKLLKGRLRSEILPGGHKIMKISLFNLHLHALSKCY